MSDYVIQLMEQTIIEEMQWLEAESEYTNEN